MNTDRQNQDAYDVIQAQQEYESMHLPHFEKEKGDEGKFMAPDFTVVENQEGEQVSTLTLEELEHRLNLLTEEVKDLQRKVNDG
jgi:uncharacterized small protein (DUF1192 family)